MPPADERKLDLFLRALEHEDPAERGAFLDLECTGDPLLRHWVETELQKQTGDGPSDRTPVTEQSVAEPELTPEVEALLAALKPEEAGERIGPYKLIEQLGEGGFGTVWLAEQERPVRREVALKILKLGMNSRQIIGRFEQERQALAMLDHPGIAKVFDAGATPTGRPFFAMELVGGKSITDYCDEQRLTVRRRIELFMRVCYAVQHAHQKGIIHRDLKPSNILVSNHEGIAVPKVIDLGLAKATLEMASERTLVVTQEERMIGTPLYMSPEQAEGSADIDTRTDVYALGVVLYELLTGRTPHDPDEMARRSHDEIRQAIREQEPPRPSSALRGMSFPACSAVAQLSGTEPAQLIRTVRGELDIICMKALAKDRRSRYQTAVALASDIQCHLLNEPIAARPPSQWYRVRKFAQRNRRAMFTVAVIALTIIAGSVVSVREALRAKAAEQSALAAQWKEAEQRRQAEEQWKRAERERASARLNEYIADIGLAQQALNAGNLGRAVQLLEKHRPQSGEADQRGWDWRYLWRLAQGDEHVAFPDHPGPANTIAFSKSGDLVAIGGQQQTTICDPRTRALVATLPHASETVAFLDTGMLLTFGRGRLVLWRTDDWSEHASWKEGFGPVALSPDGRRLAVVTREGTRIRDTATWKETRFVTGASGAVAFSPDGNTLAAHGTAGVTLWRLDDEQNIRVLADSAGLMGPGGGFQSSQQLLFAGTSLVAVQNNPSERGVFLLRIWDTRTGQEIVVMPNDPERPEHTGAITSLAASADGNTLVTTSLDHSVRLWDLTRYRRSAIVQGHRAEVCGGAFAPDGATLLTCDRAGQIKAWAVRRETMESILPEAMRPLGFSSDGHLLAALTQENAITFYDSATRQAQRSFPLDTVLTPGPPAVIALSANFEVIAQGIGEGRVKLWKTRGEPEVIEVSSRRIDSLALTPDGRTLIAGSRGQPSRTVDLRNGTRTELPFPASRFVLSPDGRILAAFIPPDFPHAGTGPEGIGNAAPPFPTGSPSPAEPGSPSVILWDLDAGKVSARLTVEMGMPLDSAFSPDGHLFATAGTDNAIRLWDTATGLLIGTCTGHKQIVRAVGFSYDGQTLATTSDDSTLRLWNVATQQELLSFQRLGRSMSRLLFSPDNRAIVVSETQLSRMRGLRFFQAPSFEEIGSVAQPERKD